MSLSVDEGLDDLAGAIGPVHPLPDRSAVLEFVGCTTEGNTQEEAIANLADAMAGWIEVRLEDGLDIPEPITDERFSGKFSVRVPRSLHRDLARHAEREGVSRNQIVVSALSRAFGA